MLIIVMEKPMQFIIVSEAPLDSSLAFCATNVENNGESAITTRPQKKRKVISAHPEPMNRKRGESKQHKQESNNEIVAILFAPKRNDKSPLSTHARPPDPMMRNEMSEIFEPNSGL